MFSKLKKKLNAASAAPARIYGPVRWVICGLGNPGPQYGGTRHNVGFCAADYLAQELDAGPWRVKYKGLCADAMIDGQRVMLLKPSTFMNLSGQSAVEALGNLKLDPPHLIVLHDDVSLPVGKLRIRLHGSDGGHNGLKNIIYLTGRDDFPRVKIGVGAKPTPDYDLADWVLGKLPEADGKAIAALFPEVLEACRLLISDKAGDAMNRFN